MICNTCNKGMVKGYIPVYGHKLMWYPEEMKRGIFFQNERPGSINITEIPLLGPEKKIAYHCPRCHTLVLTQVVQNK